MSNETGTIDRVDVDNIADAVVANLNGGINIDWSFGIFSIMTIIAGLLIAVSAVRYAYINNQYAKIIDQHKNMADKLNDKIKTDKTMQHDEYLDSLFVHRDVISTYKSRQTNAMLGMLLDLVAILMIVIVGFLTTLGLFMNSLLELVVLLILLPMLPLTHLIFHVFRAVKISNL